MELFDCSAISNASRSCAVFILKKQKKKETFENEQLLNVSIFILFYNSKEISFFSQKLSKDEINLFRIV